VRINNSGAAAGKERDDGTVEAVELKLGQHVEVEHDGLLVATLHRGVKFFPCCGCMLKPA
jgi:hypothetical protein